MIRRRLSIKTVFVAACTCYGLITTIVILNLHDCASKSNQDSNPFAQHQQLTALGSHSNAFQLVLKAFDTSLALRSLFTPNEMVDMQKLLRQLVRGSENLPAIYVITPTHTRPVQKAELTRLANTLLLVPNLHWIVIEDSEKRTRLVTNFLEKCGVSYTHLNALTDSHYKLNSSDPNWLKPRGVAQRNAGLKWLRSNSISPKSVVYFADDDNTYSLQVFDEMRFTQTASVWPVGLSGGLLYESPIVREGRVVGFYAAWKRERPFPMDMAGFAVNSKVILEHPNAYFSNDVPRGYLESHLLTSLGVSREQLEPRGRNCTEILVWHTRTEAPKLKNEVIVKSFRQDERVFIDLD